MDLGTVLGSAHLAVPQLEWFEQLHPDGLRAANLDGIALDGTGHPLPIEGEQELGRWMGLSACMVMVTDDGQPVAATAAMQGQLIPMVAGGGVSLLLTDQRLVGSYLMGKLGGEVPIRDGQSLAFSYPFELVDSIEVETRRSRFGKEKDIAIIVQTLAAPAVGVLRFEPDATIWYPSLDGQKGVDVRDLAEQVVGAVAAHRGVAAPHFGWDEGHLVAEFPARAAPTDP